MIKTGSDFSGIGAFDQALKRLCIDYETVFSCDMDKYARLSYIANYGEPEYYPENVYDREIPEEPLDIYMTSPPCFVGDTLINTSIGFKPIKDIKIGDSVLTHKNQFKKVIDFGSKRSETYILKAQGILDTETTSNHRYYVRKRYRKWNNERRCDERKFTKPKWIEVKDLNKDYFIGINIPKIEENPYSITKDIAYVLGRYVADGWYRDRTNSKGKSQGNTVILAIGKDKIDGISDKIKLNHRLEPIVNGVSKLFIHSNSLVELIQKLKLGKGAINKRIPQAIINLPKDVLIEFLNGYMDGDGHSYRNTFNATSVSKELILGLQLCIAKIYRTNSNIRFQKTPDTTIIQGRTVKQRDYYVLQFRKEMKNQSNAVVIDDVIWYPIKSVEKTNQIETVFDITVDEDHSFTANQAIVHNCQAFSLAGKRKGEDDKRGILFYNSHEFIKVNRPRFFIFENVKGLISDDKVNAKDEMGRTFRRWLDFLGGKSVNGNPVLFPHEESVPYHIYWTVLNAKDYGVPQNRERVFIVGIRDDVDNDFTWPKPIHLEKRLKDVLEKNVDEKYFLSDKMIEGFINHTERMKEKGNGFSFTPTSGNKVASAVTTRNGSRPDDNFIKIKSATSKGYETATENDSINFSQPNSETRRGRVGKGVAQTLDTACNQGVLIGAFRGRNPENPNSRKKGDYYEQTLEVNKDGVSNTLSTVQKDNVVLMKNYIQWDASGKGYNSQQDRAYYEDGCMGTLAASNGGNKHNVLMNNYKIRRLTPRECLRLMDFPDSFKIVVSDTQAYKQAGNSIVVNVLSQIISKLKL